MTATTGRPRDPAIDDAILTAAAELLREDGYGMFSVGAVAQRAGTTKPAVYRRWPVLQELAIAALAAQLDVHPETDSGCTRCDLVGAIEVFTHAFRRSLPPRVLAALIADCASDPQRHRRALDTLFEPLCVATRDVLERAAARGDLRPGTDPELVLDLLASMVHYRALYGHAPVTPALLEDLVDTLLRGIARDYDDLLATSLDRSHGGRRHRSPTPG